MSDVIVTHRLTKRYRGKLALDRLDLRVPQGAIFALLGDNGAGKTTTMKLLTGQEPASSGRAEILGKDCWSAALPLRHRLGYVPERPRFYDWMTVRELGWFTGSFHESGFRDRYVEWAERLELDVSQKLSELSKGGYARVGLALALAVNPEVLLLDEPTSGLDLLTRREFLSGMVSLAGEGRTVLISSHQIAEVERIASHVAFIHKGQLAHTAEIDDLKRQFVRACGHGAEGLPAWDGIGTVLRREGGFGGWQVTLRDPNWTVLQSLAERTSGITFESMNLEEIYEVLMRRDKTAVGADS